ncbi:MAG: AlpA family phage regulatory protein [Bradyrhizobium sp.]|nr:AlpA family phage regulatory protein [Bradyrhizobium sp.]
MGTLPTCFPGKSAGNFPKRVPIGERRAGWVASEIEAHIKRRIAARSIGLGSIGLGAPEASAAMPLLPSPGSVPG